MRSNRGRRTTAAAAAMAAGVSLAIVVASPDGARAQGPSTADVQAVSQAAAAPGELITNGGFENGTAGWAATGSATLSLGYSTRRAGAMSLKVNARTADTDGAYQAVEGLIAGATYDVSAWVHYRDAGDAITNFALVLSDTSGNSHVMAQAPVTKGSTANTLDFTQVAGAFTVPATGLNLADARVSVQTRASTTVPDIFFVDDVSVFGERMEPEPTPDPLERNDNTAAGSYGAFAKTPGTDAESRRGNPLVTQNFGADPWAMEHDGRTYVYTTNDTQEWPEYLQTGEDNNYGAINQINVWSSADLMNWTNHGAINAAGPDGITRNAQNRPNNSWAPAATAKDVDGDGEEEFFLYFANSAGGIWVLQGESPVGPFTSPLNRSLVGFDTPGVRGNSDPDATDVVWLFDPAVLVDDDGEGYLYFGGGVPTTGGGANDPDTARVIKLGDDMVSVEGEAKLINAPAIFEDSGIHKVGNKYYYTYCTNFSHNVPGMGRGDIMVMESTNPMGPWSEPKLVFPNQSRFFGVGGNNHHAFFTFQDKWYLTYHAMTLDLALQGQGNTAGFRNAHIDPVNIAADGTISEVVGTYKGAGQVAALDPYAGPLSAETIAWQAGTRQGFVGTATFEGQTPTPKLTSVHDGDWTSIAGADFGADGATALTARVLPKAGGLITVSTSPDPANVAAVLGTMAVPAGDGTTWTDLRTELPTGALAGVKDVFFRYTGLGEDELFDVQTWTFDKQDVAEPTATSVTVDKAKVVYGQPGSLQVTVTGARSGQVETIVDGTTVRATVDAQGHAVLPLAARSLKPGKHLLTVRYLGTAESAPSSGTATVKVAKAKPRLKVSAPDQVRAGGVLTVRIKVSATGLTPKGTVRVKLVGTRGADSYPGSRNAVEVERLNNGKAVVRVAVPRRFHNGRHDLTVTYNGHRYVQGATITRPVRVTGR